MATLLSRQTTREGLVTLFTAVGEWTAVYGYIPQSDLLDGRSPLLFIANSGTGQSFAASALNPTVFSFVISSFVLLRGTGWTAEDAEVETDKFDLLIRQTLRDNIGEVGWADSFEMLGDSDTGYTITKGGEYRTEQWIVAAKLYDGSA